MALRLKPSVVALAALFSLVPAAGVIAEPLLKEGDLVAICGDSITEQKDYSVNIGTYLLACQPVRNVSAVGLGWSGDSMGWFWNRNFDKDILSFHPNIITTCYGMNDGGYKAVDPKVLSTYHDGMVRLVQTMKAGGVREILVGSPGAVDSETYHHSPPEAAVYNTTLEALTQEAKKVATEQHLHFADVHTPMMETMAAAKGKLGNNYVVAGGDGVHPGPNGHLIMAYAFLKGLGFDGEIGTIKVNLKDGKTASSAGHDVSLGKSGTLTVHSTRYPFCFAGTQDSPEGTRGILPYLPFNQDLNRLTLVVEGASSQKLKVTWGKQSKEFTAEQLAHGINLAAEFLDNPFVEPFAKVREAVKKQQEFETTLVKVYRVNVINQSKELLEVDPNIKPAIDEVTAAMMKRRDKLAAASAAAVVPVTHTITITAVP